MPKDIESAFYAGEVTPGVSFAINHCVRVLAGEHSGSKAWVISLLSVHPEPTYLVELESGADIEVIQSHIQAVEETPDDSAS